MAQPHELASRVSHRDHPLRALQSHLERNIEPILSYVYRHQMVDGTPIADAMREGRSVLPDDITLSNLQLTVETSRKLISDGANIPQVARWVMAGSLDGLDGALARHLNMASPEGAVKDVVADRLGELYIAERIVYTMNSHYDHGYRLQEDLMIAMQLSTLTKAASEMSGVKTSEGGMGGMIERRRILLSSLLSIASYTHEPKAQRRQRILHKIDLSNQLLIRNSITRAKERTRAIAHSRQDGSSYWLHPALNDPESPAAIEARKYATVIAMNTTMNLDIMKQLNALTPGLRYPEVDMLMSKYPYIQTSMANTQNFLHQALEIAGFR